MGHHTALVSQMQKRYSRGLLCDCEIFANLRLKLYYPGCVHTGLTVVSGSTLPDSALYSHHPAGGDMATRWQGEVSTRGWCSRWRHMSGVTNFLVSFHNIYMAVAAGGAGRRNLL